MTGRRGVEDGFTLIELLIVMVVMGILAGIAIFGVGAFSSSAKASACATDIRVLRTANAAYLTHNGTDAPDVDALVSGGYIGGPPKSGVTFSNGATSPADSSGCATLASATSTTSTSTASTSTSTSSSTSSTSSSTTSTTAALKVKVSLLAGTTVITGPGASTQWDATVVVTVTNQASLPQAGVVVSGSWSTGGAAGCTTGAPGTCTVTVHNTPGTSSNTWTLSSLTLSGYSTGTNSFTSAVCPKPLAAGVCTAS